MLFVHSKMPSNIVFVFVTVLGVCASLVHSQLSEGSSCVMNSNKKPGKCIELKDCAEALASVYKGVFPQTCSYKGTVPIVCCELKGTPQPTPRAPASPPPTTQKPSSSRRPGEISRQKCREYGESVYKITYLPTFDLENEPIKESTCVFKDKDVTFIIGGEDAIPREFPHMALIGYGEEHNKLWKCGGSLISEQFVMTAGHCLSTRDFGVARWIRLGEHNIKGNRKGQADPQDFTIAETIKHKDYKYPSRYNDIALLRMDRRVTLNPFIRPACLHTTTSIPKTHFAATGWGLTQLGAPEGANVLQKVGIDFFSQEQCNRSYASNISNRLLKYGIVPETQLCAGGINEDKDTCQGDSGGPLMIIDQEVHCMYDIVGVTSFGKTCGAAGIPGVYTRVSHYIDWIEKTVWP